MKKLSILFSLIIFFGILSGSLIMGSGSLVDSTARWNMTGIGSNVAIDTEVVFENVTHWTIQTLMAMSGMNVTTHAWVDKQPSESGFSYCHSSTGKYVFGQWIDPNKTVESASFSFNKSNSDGFSFTCAENDIFYTMLNSDYPYTIISSIVNVSGKLFPSIGLMSTSPSAPFSLNYDKTTGLFLQLKVMTDIYMELSNYTGFEREQVNTTTTTDTDIMQFINDNALIIGGAGVVGIVALTVILKKVF